MLSTDKKLYACGVDNCGNGQCIHKLLHNEFCPCCYSPMVLVPSGLKFCSNDDAACDYEELVNDTRLFVVVAGKYDDHDENIKFISNPLPLRAAIEKNKEYKSYPFCRIEDA